MTVRVARVDAEATFPLRQRVLRPHQTLEQVAFPGDGNNDSGHFAAVDDEGDIVGTATVLPEAPPWATDGRASWRLRGMATAEAHRSQGVGALVLAAAVAHVRSHGGRLLWCNARVPAVEFYRRAGFATRGDPWVEPVIGPHIAMECLLAATPPSPAGRTP